MSQPPVAANDSAPETPVPDAVEGIVPYIPIVLPVLGAIMMFLLATIAVYMA